MYWTLGIELYPNYPSWLQPAMDFYFWLEGLIPLLALGMEGGP
jgi:hypothetical protein